MMILFWLTFKKWLLSITRITALGMLVISGCTSKDSNENLPGQDKKIPQESGSVISKPNHKEVGEASCYVPRLQGQQTRLYWL